MYIGRFAPSPSGPLHLGSIVAALASYLDAKANNGLWLVRIEDIDPPREIKGAADNILHTLESLGLYWDGEIRYQSQQANNYQQQLDTWLTNGTAYGCECSRKQVRSMANGIYNRACKNKSLGQQGHAVRFSNQQPITEFNDQILSKVTVDPLRATEDFIIHRRDGLFAYQLAVVLDDIAQGITHVVRGQDLLDTTVWQLALFNQLKAHTPQFAHIPVVMGDDGRKLSKQNHAPAVNTAQKSALLIQSLQHLNQAPPSELTAASPDEILNWAISHWDLKQIQPKSQ